MKLGPLPRYLVIALSGVVGLVLLGGVVSREVRRHTDWQDGTCVIDEVKVVTEKDSDGDDRHVALVTFHRQGEGSPRITERNPRRAGAPDSAAQRLPQGTSVPCRFDPADPSRATLNETGLPWGAELASLIPLAWLLIGLTGVAIHARRGADSVPPSLPARLSPEPTDPNTLDSWFGVLFGIGWNGMLARGISDTVDMLPCMSLHLAAGAFVSWAWTRPVLQRLRLGDTVIEVSSETVAPGDVLEVKLTQLGSGSIQRLHARLVCEEVAHYTEGTTERVERVIVHEADLVHEWNTRVSWSKPLEFHARCLIPEEAMGSFKAKRNQIVWSIRVDLQAPATPERQERFELTVGYAP